MYQAETRIRVRYAETDQMGFVYYGNYSTYYEVGRVETLRQLGVNYADIEADGILMPVLENWSKYIAPARYDDLLTIKVSIKELPSVRTTFHYEIVNEANQLLHIGKTTLVFINKDNGRPCGAPPLFTEVLAPYFTKSSA